MIYEDVSDDLEAHKKAIEAYHMLSDYANTRKTIGSYEIQIGDKHYYGIDPKDLGYDKKFGITNTLIMFGLLNPKSIVLAGAIMVFDELIENRFKYGLVMHSMKEFTEDALRKSIHSTAFMGTFEHEFVHVLDNARTNDFFSDKSSGADSTNDKKYFNHNAEFNAYYHNFVSNWLYLLRDIQENPQNTKDMLELYDITGDFQKDLLSMMRQSSQSIKFFRNLNQRNRKRIIARMYQVYKAIMDIKNSV